MTTREENARLAIISNGLLNMLVLEEEIKKIIEGNNNTVALKEATKKTEKKFHVLMVYADFMKSFVFHKTMNDYHEAYLPFFKWISQLPNKITNKQATTLSLKYSQISLLEISVLFDYCSLIQKTINDDLIQIETKKDIKNDEFKGIIDDDEDLEGFVNRHYNKPHPLDEIYNRKYEDIPGVGPRLKSLRSSIRFHVSIFRK